MLMHTVIDGKISILDESGSTTILELNTGDVFGEMVATPCLPTKGTFKFESDTKLLTLTTASLEDLATHHHEIAIKIFSIKHMGELTIYIAGSAIPEQNCRQIKKADLKTKE